MAYAEGRGANRGNHFEHGGTPTGENGTGQDENVRLRTRARRGETRPLNHDAILRHFGTTGASRRKHGR